MRPNLILKTDLLRARAKLQEILDSVGFVSISAQALNNNGTAPIDCPKEAERIKEIIYQSLKDDIMIR